MDFPSTTVGNSRQFLRWFFAVGIVAMAVAVAINVYVDPLQVTNSTRFAKLKIDDRRTKAELLGKKDTIDYVLLGSSRVQRWDPQIVRDISGKVGFNAAVVAGSNRDAAGITEWLAIRSKRRHTSFPHIIIGLSIESFVAPETGRRLMQLPDVPATRIDHESFVERLMRYKTFIQFQTFKESLRAMFYSAPKERSNTDGNVPHFRTDGYLTAGPYFVGLDGNGKMIVQDIAGQYREFYSKYGAAVKSFPYNDRELEAFERTLRVALREGDTPTVVILPMRPDFANDLGTLNREDYRRRIDGLLKKEKRRYKFLLLDYSDVATAGLADFGYFDGVHPKRVTATKIMKQLQHDDPRLH